MPFSLRSVRATLAVLLVAGLAACGDDDDNNNPPATPPAPTGLAATASEDLTSIEVTWNAVTGATGYVLERATGTPAGAFTEVGGDLTEPGFTDTDVEVDASYSYRVAAVNDEGTGQFSSIVSVEHRGRGGPDHHREHHGEPHPLRRYALHPLRLREGHRRRDAHHRAGHHDRGRPRGAGQLALDPPRRQHRRAGHRRRADRLHLGQARGRARAGRLGRPAHHRERHHQPHRATCSPRVRQGVTEIYSGGNDNTDNSGTLRYVRIEFAGYDVSAGAGQELNSLSMYAVGSGTTLEFVQSMSGLDDGFEWWGGAVDGRHLVSYEAGDDHFDWTEGYRGRNQFLIAFQSARLDPAPGAGVALQRSRGLRGRRLQRHRLRRRIRQRAVLGAGVRQLHPDRPGHRDHAHGIGRRGMVLRRGHRRVPHQRHRGPVRRRRVSRSATRRRTPC